MKQIVKLLMVAIFATATCTMAFAQNQGKKQRMSREQLAEVQARHIAKKLALNDELTNKFVEVFSQQQKEIWALGPRIGRKPPTKSRFNNASNVAKRFLPSERSITRNSPSSSPKPKSTGRMRLSDRL